MAERKTIRIAPTRDTHANWLLNNPILPEGVLGIVKGRLSEESLEFVIGDGITAYDELAKSGQSITTIVNELLASYATAKIMTSTPSASDLNEGEIAYVVEA